MEKKEVSYEESMELDRAVEYLEAIAAALKEGKYNLDKGDDSLSFEPQGPVKLEVEVKHKKGAQELEIELTWKAEGEEEEGEEEEKEEEKEPAVQDEKEGRAAVPEIETMEVPEAARGKAGIVKVLFIAGLAAAGAAVFSLLRWKKVTAAKEAAENAAEEQAEAGKDEEAGGSSRKTLERSRKKALELLKR